MADKQALRDLQNRLAERLQQVQRDAGRLWLAVDCAGQGMLFPLTQAGEIFELSSLVPVPHTQPWLAGVVNLRGGVVTVVDLARFLGLRTRPAALPPPPGRGRPARGQAAWSRSTPGWAQQRPADRPPRGPAPRSRPAARRCRRGRTCPCPPSPWHAGAMPPPPVAGVRPCGAGQLRQFLAITA